MIPTPPTRVIRWLPFRNDSSEDIPPFAVMRITGMTSNQNLPTLTVDKPNTTFQRRYLVNSATRVKAGKHGSGTFEPTYTLVGTGTPAYGEGWGPKPSEWGLYKGYYGFSILGEYRSEKTIVFAESYEIQNAEGKADGEIAADSAGDVIVWTCEGGTTSTETTFELSAWNRLDTAEAISTGKRVSVTWCGNMWIVRAAECE